MVTLSQAWRTLRPFSFPASVFPSLLGTAAAVAFHRREQGFAFAPFDALLALVGCVAIHSVSNLLNDYFDWRSGLDRLDNSGRMNPLVVGHITRSEFLAILGVVSAVAIGIAVYFLTRNGEAIAWVIAIGALSAWAYTAPPFNLKRRALGELQVILSFGVLMTLGSYLVQSGRFSSHESELSVLLLSLPQSLLIAAILHANNHRDRRGDRRAGALTISHIVGSAERSIAVGKAFVLGAYVVHGIVVLATAHQRYAIPVWTLLSMLSIPIARQALSLLNGSDNPTSEQFRLVVPTHARLQAIYGGLMVAGLVIDAIGVL